MRKLAWPPHARKLRVGRKMGCPPEVVRALPHDLLLDKILVQRAAAPVGGRNPPEKIAALVEVPTRPAQVGEP